MGFRFLEYCLQRPLRVLLITVLAVIAAAYGGQNLAVSNDYRNFFSVDNPELMAFEHLQNTYDKSDNVLVVISPKDGEVFTPKTLASIQWLTEEAWQTPFSTRVDSITNYQHTTAIEDDLEVANLVDDPNLNTTELQAVKEIATSEPLLVKRLINQAATVTAVNITVQLPGVSLDEAPIVANFVRDLAQQLEQRDSNLEVRLTGIVMMNNAFGEASLTDAATLIPGMFLVVALVLGLLLRSITLTLATIVVFALTTATAMGIAGWNQIKLDPMTMSAPTIILTMAVADAVHLLTSYISLMRLGETKFNAMREALRINLSPIFITSATTALGFLSMNFSEVPPLNNLGNIVATGVMAAFVLSVTFLPALVLVLPFGKIKPVEDKPTWFLHFSQWIIAKRRSLLIGTLAFSAVIIAFVPQNEINDEFVKYFDESVKFREDTEYAAKNLISTYSVEFSFASGEEGGIASPEYLQKLEQFVEHLYTYPETAHVYSLTDTMKRLNKNMHGDDQNWYTIPDDRELSAQYLLLYEMSLPYGLDLNNQIDVGKTATRITLTTKIVSSQKVLEMEESIASWLATNMPDIKVDASSPTLMFAHIGVRNAKSLVLGALIALFLISLIMIAALRSVKIGLISLLPNLIPAGLAFGIWGILDGQVGMSVSIVLGMTLGIVVDDSVHFLSKYLRARKEKGLGSEQAIQYAFTHVGKALVVTTVVLVIGFLVLTFSTFKMNSDMGLVTAITLASALFIDFLLLPPLLMLLDKKQYKHPEAAANYNVPASDEKATLAQPSNAI